MYLNNGQSLGHIAGMSTLLGVTLFCKKKKKKKKVI
jgi:hypothetical protein